MDKPVGIKQEPDYRKIIGDKLKSVLGKAAETRTLFEQGTTVGKKLLKEAVVLLPKTFQLKTEYLSAITKELHFKLYKSEVDSYNKISSKLDTVPRTDADNPNNSEFRRLKLDEQSNMNGVKLHELYFNNISDLHSEIRLDSIPYIRLANFWGTFETWQFDFRACGMASTEGWAVLYWEPFKQRYCNTFIEKNAENIPVMGIPVLVVDTHHHAWFRDHPGDKQNYINSVMKEIQWSVVEARMAIAEMCNLHQIFMVEPVGNTTPEVRIRPSSEPPIGGPQVVSKIPVS